ncbi:costars domain-containing protein [Blastocladiella britannica]|nr:costars domain-containing protein [Blastocladiella britannica]
MVVPVVQEIRFLVTAIQRLGTQLSDGTTTVKYGLLAKDDLISNTLEGLLGTLKAAKKRKIVAFKPEILLSPVHDAEDVVLLTTVVPDQ